MSFTQLDPPLPIDVEGKGKGYAFAVIDYGPEHNLIWVTGLNDSGEIWCAPNPLVRLQTNWTMGRLPMADPTAAPNGWHHGGASANGSVKPS
ncbi:MAG: hypothetical protein QM605_05995 [Sphingobium sp.]